MMHAYKAQKIRFRCIFRKKGKRSERKSRRCGLAMGQAADRVHRKCGVRDLGVCRNAPETRGNALRKGIRQGERSVWKIGKIFDGTPPKADFCDTVRREFFSKRMGRRRPLSACLIRFHYTPNAFLYVDPSPWHATKIDSIRIVPSSRNLLDFRNTNTAGLCPQGHGRPVWRPQVAIRLG